MTKAFSYVTVEAHLIEDQIFADDTNQVDADSITYSHMLRILRHIYA